MAIGSSEICVFDKNNVQNNASIPFAIISPKIMRLAIKEYKNDSCWREEEEKVQEEQTNSFDGD